MWLTINPTNKTLNSLQPYLVFFQSVVLWSFHRDLYKNIGCVKMKLLYVSNDLFFLEHCNLNLILFLLFCLHKILHWFSYMLGKLRDMIFETSQLQLCSNCAIWFPQHFSNLFYFPKTFIRILKYPKNWVASYCYLVRVELSIIPWYQSFIYWRNTYMEFVPPHINDSFKGCFGHL